MTQRLLTESRVVVRYLFSIVVPNPALLSIEHDVPLSLSLLEPPSTILSILVIVIAVGLSFYYRKTFPVITFGIIWFFINLTIESTIVPLELMFDHRMYLPSLGIIMAIVEAIRLASSRITICPRRELNKMGWAALGIVCAGLCLLTFARNEDWKNIISINRDAVEKAPKNPRAHANYAVALHRVGKYQDAIKEARKAIELGETGFEDYVVAATVIVRSHMSQKLWELAVDEGEKLLNQKPANCDAASLHALYLMLSHSYLMQGNPIEAFRKAIASLWVVKRIKWLKSDSLFIYNALDVIVREARHGEWDLDGDGNIDPGNLAPEVWIARKLLELNDIKGARLFAEKARDSLGADELVRQIAMREERTRRQSTAWSFRDKYLRKPWDVENALLAGAYVIEKLPRSYYLGLFGDRLLQLASNISPTNPDVHLLQAWSAHRKGNDGQAVASARKAIELDPQYAKAWIALGFFAQKQGDVATSLTAFRQTLELYPGYPKRDVLEDLMAQLEASAVAKPEAKRHPVQAAA
jgi:tetratricopeptide (TPR) repeat protein